MDEFLKTQLKALGEAVSAFAEYIGGGGDDDDTPNPPPVQTGRPNLNKVPIKVDWTVGRC